MISFMVARVIYKDDKVFFNNISKNLYDTVEEAETYYEQVKAPDILIVELER